jgi:hypothetical protein
MWKRIERIENVLLPLPNSHSARKIEQQTITLREKR